MQWGGVTSLKGDRTKANHLGGGEGVHPAEGRGGGNPGVYRKTDPRKTPLPIQEGGKDDIAQKKKKKTRGRGGRKGKEIKAARRKGEHRGRGRGL